MIVLLIIFGIPLVLFLILNPISEKKARETAARRQKEEHDRIAQINIQALEEARRKKKARKEANIWRSIEGQKRKEEEKKKLERLLKKLDKQINQVKEGLASPALPKEEKAVLKKQLEDLRKKRIEVENQYNPPRKTKSASPVQNTSRNPVRNVGKTEIAPITSSPETTKIVLTSQSLLKQLSITQQQLFLATMIYICKADGQILSVEERSFIDKLKRIFHTSEKEYSVADRILSTSIDSIVRQINGLPLPLKELLYVLMNYCASIEGKIIPEKSDAFLHIYMNMDCAWSNEDSEELVRMVFPNNASNIQ